MCAGKAVSISSPSFSQMPFTRLFLLAPRQMGRVELRQCVLPSGLFPLLTFHFPYTGTVHVCETGRVHGEVCVDENQAL